jgi:hypothetical protein
MSSQISSSTIYSLGARVLGASLYRMPALSPKRAATWESVSAIYSRIEEWERFLFASHDNEVDDF